MVLYFLNQNDLSLRGISTCINYEINLNADYTGKSRFDLVTQPIAREGDYVLVKDGSKTLFLGIVALLENEDGENAHRLTAHEMPALFNRNLFVSNEDILRTVGIEDFIKSIIEKEFSQSQDVLMNLPYIRVTASTHTPIAVAIPTYGDNGEFNFQTYLGNALTLYGVNMDFAVNDGWLDVHVSCPVLVPEVVDATLPDIPKYDEFYEVDAVTKVTVCLAITDYETNEITRSYHNYYLKNDRTITTNVNDPDRAKGRVDITVCTEEETLDQTAYDVFTANRYQHRIAFSALKRTRLFNTEHLIPGHPVHIKTRAGGVRDTIVTECSESSDRVTIDIICGNLKITLLEKLKEAGQ